MKSIVQEASTIAKAIEQGWKLAGEPKEFSVKVLELPEHNFIGLTTRSAKVALMFGEAPQRPQQKNSVHAKHAHPRTVIVSEQAPIKSAPRQNPVAPVASQPAPVAPLIAKVRELTPREPREPRKKAESLWNEELIACAQEWLGKTLQLMDSSVTFTIEPQNFYLRIIFDKPILADEAKEKHLLASLSSLMLATVKKHFRKALRGHKIVLTHK